VLAYIEGKQPQPKKISRHNA